VRHFAAMRHAFLVVLLSWTFAAAQEPAPPAAPADRIIASETDPDLRSILEEVAARNPELAALAARARAVEARPAQARSLPDPQAAVTAYLLTPESRVGPQRGMLALSQRFPWFGKLDLREKAAVFDATAARARLEARRLALVTEARALYHEIGFIDAETRVTSEDRETLAHYEEVARSRYAAGMGLQQGIIKLQAEITRDETRLLGIARRRANVVASLNALRDRPESIEMPPVAISFPGETLLDMNALVATAMQARPELAASEAEVERASILTDLAHKEYSPDLTLGLTYTLVDRRDDPAGLMNPPEDDGRDILGVTAGINLPIWRNRLSAGVRESVESRSAAEQSQRQVVVGIRREIDDLAARLPLIGSQRRLIEDVLQVQARESLRSAEAAYAAGTTNALDLLDAERVLLDVRIALQRSIADYATALARLEGAVGAPLERGRETGDARDER